MTVIAVTVVTLPKGQSIDDVLKTIFIYIPRDTQPPGVRPCRYMVFNCVQPILRYTDFELRGEMTVIAVTVVTLPEGQSINGVYIWQPRVAKRC